VNTKREDLDRAHRVTRAGDPARRAAVDPAVLAPLPAYGTRLRGIRFRDGNSASRLIVELVDDLAGTGRTHLLGSYPPGTLCGLIERFADIAGGVGKRRSHLSRRLVAQVADAPRRLAEHSVLAALQPLVAARPLLVAREGWLKTRELLVAVLDGRLGGASADENDSLTICGDNQRAHAVVYAVVYAEVYADDGVL
jgi:hypothetical protein